MKAFLVDIGICNGCYCCQIACKDEHVANDWTPYAKPQPETGQFWLKIHETVRGTIPKVKVAYTPILCMHCDDAPCIASCPIEGAIYKRDDGLVIIDPVKCTGCKKCVDACPYRTIYFNEDLNIAQKCTGCAHLLDRDWKEPRCVDACPTGAIRFMEENEAEAKAFIKDAEVLKPEAKSKPRVYYKNLPKRFIAGTVYDPVKNEVVSEASCTLSQIGTSNKLTATTDNYGDFWFEKLEVSKFNLRIEKAGKVKEFNGISTDKDVNLGDIPLK
jgi:tetrathionate reductase subunit B